MPLCLLSRSNRHLQQFARDLTSGAISEGTVNQTGYSLLGNKKIADAILVFQKNVELHPGSWNVYDSLGEAYVTNEDNRRPAQRRLDVPGDTSRATGIGGNSPPGGGSRCTL